MHETWTSLRIAAKNPIPEFCFKNSGICTNHKLHCSFLKKNASISQKKSSRNNKYDCPVFVIESKQKPAVSKNGGL